MENQKQRVYDALEQLKIKYEVVEHEPVHTMEDMDRLGLPQKGTLCKNLFLRDAKGEREDRGFKDVRKTVGGRKFKLCFGRPFGKISRVKTGKCITVWIDE